MAVSTGAAILGAAGIGAAGSFFGGREQARGAEASADVQRQMYEQTREDLEPYREFGQQALNPLMQTAMSAGTFGPGHPAYQSIMKSRAATGALGSGGTLTALSDYWSTVYQPQRFNQLYNIASLGQNAAAQTGTAAMQAGANIGNSLMAAGAAQGAGLVGIGNAAQNALGNYYYMNRLSGMGG